MGTNSMGWRGFNALLHTFETSSINVFDLCQASGQAVAAIKLRGFEFCESEIDII